MPSEVFLFWERVTREARSAPSETARRLLNLPLMSSLADALILQHDDVDMKPDYTETNEEDDEEMTDLFGADAQVENATHEEYVFKMSFLRLAILIFYSRHASPGDTTDGSERLGSAEAEQRRALEYEEDDVPPEMAIEEREASVSFPNLPVPSSSDQDVSSFTCHFHAHCTKIYARTGSYACPTLLKWTLNHFMQILILGRNTMKTMLYSRPTTCARKV